MVFAASVYWVRYAIGGLIAGLGSSLLAILFDLYIFPGKELTIFLALALVGVIFSTFAAGGVALGLVTAAFTRAGRACARLTKGRGEILFAAALVGILVIPGSLYALSELARGRKAAALLGPLHVKLLLISAGSLLCALFFGGGLAIARWVRHCRRLLLVLGVLLLGTSVLFFWADATLYRRLYQFLHHLLLFAYFLSGLLATVALSQALLLKRGPAWPPLKRGYVLLGFVFLVLLTAGGWGARHILSQDQHLRYCALELTVVAKKVLTLLPLQVESESPLFLETTLAQQARRPSGAYHVPGAHVVLVSIDALRPDHLGSYGYKRPTSPNIDALAARSIRFQHAYCQVPLTCYSVPSIHTGDYLRSTLPLLVKPPPTLARILAGQGYTTAAFYNASMFFCDDKKAMSYGTNQFGFSYAETVERAAGQLTDQVINYLHTFHGKGKQKLFLWIHYFDVHEPYRPHAKWSFGNQNIDLYDSEIGYVDAAIGRLVAAISQLSQPTIFILTADHGEEFKEHGGYNHGSSLYEEQIRIPLIIGVPGLRPRVVQTPAQSIDIVPTVMSLLGVRIPDSVRGRSLIDELQGKENPGQAAYAEIHTKKMVRLGSHKLIHDYRRGIEELYQLEDDPGERVNLIGRRPKEYHQLKTALNKWFDQISVVASNQEKDRPEAIDLGRIGDRRAVPLLAQLIRNPLMVSKWRQEAAQLLGQLQDTSVAQDLWMSVADDDRQVAQEAAIALGELKDKRARVILPYYMLTTNYDVRLRAGIALARVDSPAATPALLEGLFSHSWEIQNRAAHYLGYVGDRRAIPALLHVAKRLHLRSRAALALGRLGRRIKDKRIFPFLLDLARREPHAEVRRRALTSLALLNDRQAIHPLADLMASEPELVWVPDILSNLNGIGSYWVPGLDFSPSRSGLTYGWGACEKGSSTIHDSDLSSNWCAIQTVPAGAQLNLQRRPFHPTQVLLRIKAVDPAVKGMPLTVLINGKKAGSASLKGGWQNLKWVTKSSWWQKGRNVIRFQLEDPLARQKVKRARSLYLVDFFLLSEMKKRASLSSK